MADEPISRAWPPPAATVLDDDQLTDCYAIAERSNPSVRFNFVSSIDGAATANGLSGGLSGKVDKRVFDILRRLCDVVLVGAGTLRAEGYGAMRLDEASVRWRRANGLADHPVFAIVSGRLALDPGSAVFTDAPVRAIVVTIGASPQGKREALSRVADTIICGEEKLDARGMLAELAKRGLRQVLCEGGPTLFGTFLEADSADELCLTVSPLIAAGDAPRLASSSNRGAWRFVMSSCLPARSCCCIGETTKNASVKAEALEQRTA